MDDIANDRVVRELDVCLCSASSCSQSAQVYLMQYPLRPPWRPYETEAAEEVRIKPVAKRLEMKIPLDTSSVNYDSRAPSTRATRHLLLRSNYVSQPANTVVGVVRDGKLLLVPVNEVVHMRPSLSHMDAANAANAKSSKASSSSQPADDDTAALKAINVTVQKRETERQAAARLRSYAHLQAQEASEPWCVLKHAPPNDDVAHALWKQMHEGVDTSASTLRFATRSDYLAAVFPKAVDTSGEAGDELEEAADIGVPTSSGLATASASNLPEGVLKALAPALRPLFHKHRVCNMADVRKWLVQQNSGDSNAAVAKEAAHASDAVLHDAIINHGGAVAVQRSYVAAQVGDAKVDPLRSMVVGMLQEKECVRRADIFEAAREKSVELTEPLYNKVVKDLCFSRGNAWFIKVGGDVN